MNKKHSVSSNMLSRSLICIRVLQFLWINERTFLFHEFLNKYMKHDADRRPCLLPGSGQFKCWSLVSISNRLCSSELSSVLIFLWAECLHEVRMNVEYLSERRHAPLLDVSGALWVFLQGLHDLTVVQHQSHQLVLSLGFGRGAVDRPDQLQLLQVLEGLRTGEKS